MTVKFRSKILPQGALIEYIPRGAYVKVSAVDPVTHEEVSIVGDPRSGSQRLSHEAVKKLEYVLRRKFARKAEAAKKREQGPIRGKRAETPSGWDL